MGNNKGRTLPGDSVVKNPPASAGNARDVGSIPGLERSPGEGNGNPLQCSCLENPMDRGAWQVTVHRVTKSRTRLNQVGMHTCNDKENEASIKTESFCQAGRN